MGNGRADAVGKGRAVITAMDEDGVQARCDISIKDIAVVNSSGLVTRKEAGTINIICRFANGKEASCTVVVKGSGSLADIANTASTSRPGGSYTNVQNSDNDTYQEESFYGIWCGASKSRDDAEAYLPAVKKIYSGAYVKYSGKWQG